jgi:hypothetical protein
VKYYLEIVTLKLNLICKLILTPMNIINACSGGILLLEKYLLKKGIVV